MELEVHEGGGGGGEASYVRDLNRIGYFYGM